MMNFNFMAFGKVKESVDAVKVKNYVGYDNCYVVAINPSLEERNKLYNSQSDKEPTYNGVNNEGKKTATVAVYLKLESQEDVIIPAYFTLTEDYRWNKDHTKVQVIDKYGYSAWATEEQVKSHAILLSSSGNPLRITTEYRPAYVGEIALIEFIKNFLCIDELLAYKNNAWVVDESLSKTDCECYLDTAEFFKGNFKEVKELTTLAPNNRVKVAFGVRTTEDGNLRQAVYTNKTVRCASSNANTIFKEIEERKANGALQTTTYENVPVKEYTVAATTFVKKEASNTSDDPWATPSTLEF